ncbi:tail fiber protein [Pseudomonas sp. TWP3-2]|uniref:phage tail protein n=1 Tax=Pseudomonas sp. TWP3-2 TaxID=2804574 RepID=UPI003CFAF39D
MADPLILNPTLTLAGQAAAFNANNTGIELIVDSVSFGLAHYDPNGSEVALVNPIGNRVPFAGGSRPTPYQLRISAAWKEDVGDVPIGEIAFWSGDTLVFVWSRADGQIASYKTNGVAYVMFADLAFAQVPANSITIVIDPDQSAALAALSAHEGAANAHPQYLLRADVAKDAGPLMGLVHSAGSAANALVLKLDAPESKLAALAKFQRFQFVAASTNTGPVTVNIAGIGVKAVKRGGDNGLIELDAGDIKAGSLYDLNYDGASFQLGGGVGSGKAFERFSFTASVAQTIFNAPHVPGSIIVLHNGREITDYASAADGSKVTKTIPCNLGDNFEILAFKSFRVADGYTKAEVQALMKTASGLPVGSMLPVPTGIVPIGYMELDGSVQSIATYPDLAAYLGTAFNKGNEGAGNFRLPDSRGEFLRGWDHGRGVDAGRAIGSWAADSTKAHFHKLPTSSGGGQIYDPMGDVPVTVLKDGAADWATRATFGGDNDTLSIGVVRTYNQSAESETRPRSLAVMWCIKAWNAPVNQGQIDVAALAAELEKMKSAVPVGALMPFPDGVVPPGYLEADGSLFLDALYPDLAAYLNKKYNIAGDPANSTRLPETRGEFLRGWDHGRGVDAGRVIGSYQTGTKIQGDDGVGPTVQGIGNVNQIDADPAPGFSADINYTASGITAGSFGLPYWRTVRPRNLAVMWCIKAWNTPVNQGTIDIAVLAPLATQATEIKDGTAKVATQNEVDAGADDTKFVTAKKLFGGFGMSIGTSGFIRLPSWLGGFTFQWGITVVSSNGDCVITLPTNYNTRHVQILGISGAITGMAVAYTAVSLSGAVIPCYVPSSGAKAGGGYNVVWLSIGK